MTTAHIHKIDAQQHRRPSAVTEELANALRQKRTDAFNTASPFAACLLPLLKELGWDKYARELVEALPHFSDQFDLIDLRNTLVTLGYQSSPKKTSIDRIKEELYPCLFLSQKGDILVLMQVQGRQVRYFDARQQKTLTAELGPESGTAYLFTNATVTHAISAAETPHDQWFAQLLNRFRKLIVHLLAMTFFVNLVAIAIPLFIMLIYDKVIGAQSADSLPFLVSGVGALLLFDLTLRLLKARVLGFVAGRLDYLIGVETFRKMILLPPLFTERSTVAAQLSRLKQFDTVRDFFTGPNAAIALELPFVALFIGVIALLAGPVALIPIAMMLLFLVLGLFWIPSLKSLVQRSGKARTAKQFFLMQTLAGRKEIKAIGGESLWWERFREVSGEAVMANHRTLVANGVLRGVVQGLTTLTGVAVIGVGTQSVIGGDMTVGALIATMALLWRVLSPIQSAFLSFSQFRHVLKAMKQIDQLMRLKTERHNSHSGLLAAGMQGRVNVDRVSFRYGPDQDPALLGVTFDVEPGEMLAIVGHTGSGKSTMLKLIAGMYAPQAGSLAIDDLDVRQVNATDLRRAIAYVPQQTKFFRGSIAQNLRLNNGLATDEDLKAAAEQAGVLDDIRRLPKAFDTVIGDSSTDRLPPGFLRGLSMARAFLSPARILLMDEPGASLDDASDRRFVEQVNRLKGQRTIVMVSHRPSHIRLADKVLLLKQGSTQFMGPPDLAIAKLLEVVQ